MATPTEFINSSLTHNHTHPPTQLSFDPVFDTVMLVMAVVIIAVNGFVIFLFLWKPFLKEITNYFLVSLAVSDGLTGLLVIPLYISCVVVKKIGLCFCFDLSHRVTAFATVYHLLLITCDRYVAITRPFRYSAIFSLSVAVVSLISVWCFSLFLPLIQLTWYDVNNLEDTSPEIREFELRYDVACLVIAFLIPVISMAIAYAGMLRIVTRHARAIEATTRQRLILSKEKRATAIFATMLLIYIICWSSFFFFALNADLENRIDMPNAVRNFLFFFRFCTSVFNPLLYVFFKTDFRKALRESFMWYQCRAAETGFRLQNCSISHNNDDDNSPLAALNGTTRPRK